MSPPLTTIISALLLLNYQSSSSSAFTFVKNSHIIHHNTFQKPQLQTRQQQQQQRLVTSSPSFVLYAGGFEWEDPDETFDQGVENPFKNPAFKGMTIDAGRLLAPRLQGTNMYFIGMMGSGKSAVGDIVARRMGTYNFLDTDSIIETATNMTIPQIFSTEGEEAFRDVESQVLNGVHAYVRCVISTGGGVVIRLQNWSKLQTGIVIWLDVDPETILKRLQKGGTENRPLLQTEDPLQTLRDLLEERKAKYEQADVRIEVEEGDSEEDVANKVFRAVHDYIDDNPPAWKKAKAKAQADGLDWVK